MMEKAIRLSPRDPQMHLLRAPGRGRALHGRPLRRRGRARRGGLRLRADQPHVYRVLAAAYGYLGRSAEALEALDEDAPSGAALHPRRLPPRQLGRRSSSAASKAGGARAAPGGDAVGRCRPCRRVGEDCCRAVRGSRVKPVAASPSCARASSLRDPDHRPARLRGVHRGRLDGSYRATVARRRSQRLTAAVTASMGTGARRDSPDHGTVKRRTQRACHLLRAQ